MSSEALDTLLEQLSAPENREPLESILRNLPVISGEIQELRELREKGILQSLMGIGYLVASLKDVMSSEMISGTAGILDALLELMGKIAKPEFMAAINEIVDGISSGSLATGTKVKGTWSLLKDVKDPDIERGLAILLSIMKILGRMGKPDTTK
ncbi:MAG: DUF1641 domain-containing protein [Candidatus Thermoplasmatota archaeon]|nr:DUF1641 domain-containing protein [Candidatus Thermoplasmatota archaeon]